MLAPLPFHTWKHNNWVNSFTVDQLSALKPQKVWDVGCGDGFYGKLVKHILPTASVSGIELNPRWASHCKKLNIYDKILEVGIEDAIKLDIFAENDLIIFGDVLEHLEKENMTFVLSEAVRKVKYVIINGPVGFQPQDHPDPEEIHRCGVTKADFSNYTIVEYNESNFTEHTNQMMNCVLTEIK